MVVTVAQDSEIRFYANKNKKNYRVSFYNPKGKEKKPKYLMYAATFKDASDIVEYCEKNLKRFVDESGDLKIEQLKTSVKRKQKKEVNNMANANQTPLDMNELRAKYGYKSKRGPSRKTSTGYIVTKMRNGTFRLSIYDPTVNSKNKYKYFGVFKTKLSADKMGKKIANDLYGI